MKRISFVLATLFFLAAPLAAQTPARTAYRIRYGATLPPVCNPSVGDVFALTSGNQGIYKCGPAANSWRHLDQTGTLDVRSFGALGDGTHNDHPMIQAAITVAAGTTVYFPPGTYRVNAGLTHTSGINLRGVPGQSIIRPGPGVAVALTAAAPIVPAYGQTSLIEGIQIDGTLDPTGTGIQIGTVATSTSNLVLRRVEVTAFDGVGGVGILVGDAANIAFEDCVTTSNETGVRFYSTTHGTPTLVRWLNGMVMFNTGTGIDIQEGRNITFRNTEIESNHHRGIWVHPPAAGQTTRLYFEDDWIEGNQTVGGAGAYEVDIDGTAAGAATDITFVRPYHVPTGAGSKFLQSDSATRLRIEDPYLTSGAPANIRIGGAATVFTVLGWNPAPNGPITGGGIITYFNGASETANFAGFAQDAATTSFNQAVGMDRDLYLTRYLIWTGLAFGALPASANGTVIYCTDCTIASPCAGAGNGAIAKRLNGIWVCN